MTIIGTPLTPKALKVMMLGAGELGKEVVIELQRLGVEVIAVDRYENAPAQQSPPILYLNWNKKVSPLSRPPKPRS